jgi:flavin-dependent dehydrogenase
MEDVVIVGAGPAGATAALVLARAGVRVRVFDRATFPREKVCGDTINPGTLAALRRLGVSEQIERDGLRVDGMMLTGEGGALVEGRYPDGVCGRAMVRRELDWILLQRALQAGAQFEAGVPVQRVVVADRRGTRLVAGVAIGTKDRMRSVAAPVVIAADGRRSAIAFGLGFARHPVRPRRWAVSAYFENFVPNGVRPRHRLQGLTPSTLGEMHVRRGHYIGVAAVPGGLTNVCLVKPSGPADADLRNPAALIARELARDPMLRDRAAGARLVAPPVVLGPLAVDVDGRVPDGLLLTGDAAGFIDPMTGDGLRFAVRGGELAADAALRALAHGWSGVHAQLARDRRREFGGKWRFNRVLRGLVGSSHAVGVATRASRYVPRVFEAIVAHAGDCGLDGNT